MTADVDITLALELDALPAFLEAAHASGFHERVSDPLRLARETRVVPLVYEPSGMPVDVVLAGPGLEELFLAEAVTHQIGHLRVPVIRIEHLLATKVLAGRAKDLEDVRAILSSKRTAVDVNAVRALLAELQEALDRADLVPLFDSLRRDARH
ncbi:MAG: hypothetical protein L0Y64_08380 [Myxococcaceae bacterium]|nr:hypothetical protein [Myxococcaceae bacterium]